MSERSSKAGPGTANGISRCCGKDTDCCKGALFWAVHAQEKSPNNKRGWLRSILGKKGLFSPMHFECLFFRAVGKSRHMLHCFSIHWSMDVTLKWPRLHVNPRLQLKRVGAEESGEVWHTEAGGERSVYH